MAVYFAAISIRRATVFVFLVSCFCRVRCDYLCGSRFDDIPSRTVLAPVVFEGKAQHIHSWTVESGTGKGSYYNYTFGVETVFKGSLPLKDRGEEYRNIVVGVFAEKGIRTSRCVSPKVEIGLAYLVFLNSTIQGRTRRLNIYRITSFPEVASNETIETVMSHSCSKCGRKPSCQIQLRGKTNGTIGQKLQLHCRVKGKPLPQVNWAKDGSPLVPKKGLRIKRHSQGSSLEIRELKQEDSGLYACQAANVVGNSNWSKIQVKATYVSDSIPCLDQSYCLNNGTCYILQSLSRPYCKCKEPFEGKRCIQKRVDIEGVNNGPEDKNPFDIGYVMPIIGVVLVVVVTICIVVLSYCAISNCWRQHHAKKAKENLENSYQAYSFGIQEGSMIRSGRRMSKSGVPLAKDVFTQTEEFPMPARQFAIVRPDGVRTVHVHSNQTQKESTGLGKASPGLKVSTGAGKASPNLKVSTGSGKTSSSVRRGRLNGCSVTPPDFPESRRKVHSPITEKISVSSDVTEEHPKSRTDAVERVHGNHILPSDVPVTGAVYQCEDSNRNSEYDNCWLEDARDVHGGKDSHSRIDKTCNEATSNVSVQKSRT